MSTDYNVLINASSVEEKGDALAFLNADINEDRWCGELFWIKNSDPEGHSPNGCMAGYFKNLNVTWFKEAMLEAPWKWPGQVICIIREGSGDTIEVFMPFVEKYLEGFYEQYRAEALEKLKDFQQMPPL